MERIAVAPPPSGQASPHPELEVRLARTDSELRRAQRLRYRVFFEELNGSPGALARLQRRDGDAFDAICRHVVVLDHAATAKPFRTARPRVVATSRMLTGAVAERQGGFYSAAEFELRPMLDRHPGLSFLELGRSCVHPRYRARRTADLLWQGIWSYCLRENVDVIFGCASLPGADAGRHGAELAFLRDHARSPAPWLVRARPDRYVAMGAGSPAQPDPMAAARRLPTLIKGYLRLGATFGDGAVVDRAFDTTDVFVVLPVTAIGQRYRERFDPRAVH